MNDIYLSLLLYHHRHWQHFKSQKEEKDKKSEAYGQTWEYCKKSRIQPRGKFVFFIESHLYILKKHTFYHQVKYFKQSIIFLQMDEVERSVNEVNRMLGDPDNANTSGLPSSKKGGTRSKVRLKNWNVIIVGYKLDSLFYDLA